MAPAGQRAESPYDIHHGESVVALGMRRTGKTTLMKSIYRELMDADTSLVGYVVDSNVQGDFSGWGGGTQKSDCPIIYPGPAGRQVVWQPPRDTFAAYEDFFGRLFDAAKRYHIGAVVFVDELSALGGGDQHDEYARLLKRGRKRSDFPGITVLSLTQELAQRARVPRQTFSQMTHLFRFYVQHPYDVQESNRLLHLPPHVQPEHEHGFWHSRMDRPPIKPTYYKGLERLL